MVCVGDVVRKGPDSKGALALVRERENVLSVRGNNEQGLVDGSKSDPALDEDESVVDTQTVLMREARVASEREDVTRGMACLTDVPNTGLLVDSTETGEVTDLDDGGTNDAGTATTLPQVLTAHRDRWYEPDSATYSYAVRTPDGDRTYRKTARGAAKVIERYYGSEAGTEPVGDEG